MLPHEINAKLAEHDCSSSLLANALGVRQSSVSNVIHRYSDSKRIALAIAKVLELPVEQVFPDRPQYSKNYSRQALREQKLAALRQQLAQ